MNDGLCRCENCQRTWGLAPLPHSQMVADRTLTDCNCAYCQLHLGDLLTAKGYFDSDHDYSLEAIEVLQDALEGYTHKEAEMVKQTEDISDNQENRQQLLRGVLTEKENDKVCDCAYCQVWGDALRKLREYGAQEDERAHADGILEPDKVGYVFGIADEALKKEDQTNDPTQKP